MESAGAQGSGVFGGKGGEAPRGQKITGPWPYNYQNYQDIRETQAAGLAQPYYEARETEAAGSAQPAGGPHQEMDSMRARRQSSTW